MNSTYEPSIEFVTFFIMLALVSLAVSFYFGNQEAKGVKYRPLFRLSYPPLTVRSFQIGGILQFALLLLFAYFYITSHPGFVDEVDAPIVTTVGGLLVAVMGVVMVHAALAIYIFTRFGIFASEDYIVVVPLVGKAKVISYQDLEATLISYSEGLEKIKLATDEKALLSLIKYRDLRDKKKGKVFYPNYELLKAELEKRGLLT